MVSSSYAIQAWHACANMSGQEPDELCCNHLQRQLILALHHWFQLLALPFPRVSDDEWLCYNASLHRVDCVSHQSKAWGGGD